MMKKSKSIKVTYKNKTDKKPSLHEIPYLNIGGIECCVKVKPIGNGVSAKTLKTPRPPETEDGRLVFALPGGGCFISQIRLDEIET